MQSPDDILNSGSLPNPLTDAQLIHDCALPDSLIYLSLGETWTPPPDGLTAALQRLPAHTHGYTLSPYGLPALRQILKSYITRTHQLPADGAYDVAVSQAGTRTAMANFAEYLLSRHNGPQSVLVPDPGWDYSGIFAPMGFTVHRYPMLAEQDWQPVPEQLTPLMTPHSLLVLNPQHNPTGVEWSPQTVTRLIQAALERQCAILIDDAYYALHTPGQSPTNALRTLIEQAGSSAVPPWLAVRTLGKQFRCNGWGIGALSAAPETLTALAHIAHRRTYGTALPLQAAMATWLQQPAADHYLDRLRQHYAANRELVAQRLAGLLGFPQSAIHAGTCTSYMRFQVPPRLVRHGDEEYFRRLCLSAGVLPGRGSMIEGNAPDAPAYVRLHLGHTSEELERALQRLRRAELGWE
ncbi:pyridoxal phosphate-dependent aminotransferase [Serratia rubidaea]|uniref:pyridoxal phosphate-dependent aminotransferase n=1 Tax=Serratia rubidaea TaxID=61652 RepID=UPI000773926E|nr:pyridoxal phosphate-dependent aminotransferase [Serratia rubidaea]AML58682.1 Aspartate aminotransferase / Glutamine-dependent 2-keto-4-methylthiobutyrate transaminase [Serratia rubidaea]WBF43381.1 pyridoxal phosphate-dependent aminotransferase [Serratia rubidaea]